MTLTTTVRSHQILSSTELDDLRAHQHAWPRIRAGAPADARLTCRRHDSGTVWVITVEWEDSDLEVKS